LAPSALSGGGGAARKAGIMAQNHTEWRADFQGWFLSEVADWARRSPHLIRLACLVTLRGQTPG